MPLVNATKNTVLADSFEEARSWKEQFCGLMFRKAVPLVFFFDSERIIELHSWFCRGPVDLVFLNDEWEVVEIFREWGPWKTYRSRKKAMFLIELPAGSVFRSRTELGDIVQFSK